MRLEELEMFDYNDKDIRDFQDQSSDDGKNN